MRDLAVPSPRAVGSAAARLAALATDVWGSVTARQLWAIALLLLGYTGILTLAALPMLLQRGLWTPIVNALLSAELSGFAVVFAVLAVERTADVTRHRWWPYVLAVTGGVAVATLVLWFLSQYLIGIGTAYVDAGAAEPFGHFVLRHWLHASLVCGLGTAVYVARRKAVERMVALRTLQKERSDSEKLLVKTRLAVLQARLEPRFLLDVLGRVERLYERDAKAADTLLQQLVRYLRAALPEMREPESTLGKESRLAEAYLALHNRGGDASLRVTLGGSATEHTSVPPMLLLPLIDYALNARPEPDVSREFDLEAECEAGRLKIVLRDAGGGFAPETDGSEAIDLLRQRLRALYGESASLVLRQEGGRSAAVIDVGFPAA